MEIEFDPEKSAKNEAERGLPFALAAELDWQRALVFVDDRHDYGEERLIAVAPRHGRLHVVCFVDQGDVRRIISFRKANKREEKAYAEATADR
ncbi:BrnT family toxin [Lichenifustis flavocetrariae]|uniref:BrnT family toxin n=1 Tax=Lichenifustis flavocetrariae TaxID=2949735 RepID=A0AA42CM87_9HYPH|nr:BrnT family toxin [Lichenifustis flavocetrariae]MCW6512303.1 BrnT family toxin [Lichenifustis flavocetrariae]